MPVQVYGCNHVAIEVDDVKKAVAFYRDVFNLEQLDQGEGDAFFKLGQHQFLAIFQTKELQRDRRKHFGIIVRDEAQIAEIRDKLTTKYKIELIPPFRCDFRDPWGNRIQVVDLHDESLVWLLPYQEMQKGRINVRATTEQLRLVGWQLCKRRCSQCSRELIRATMRGNLCRGSKTRRRWSR